MEQLFSDFVLRIGIWDSVRVTLLMSVFSTLISSVFGISLGLLLERVSFPGKPIIIRINRTLMGLPPVVAGLAAYLLLMRRGPLGTLGFLFTIKGMVFAQTLIITPIICGMVYSYAVRNAPAIRNFGSTMGANKRQLNRLLIREMKDELYFAMIAGYGRSISEVGAVFLVGGNIKNSTRTMTTAIATLKSAGIFTEGIVLGLLLLAIAFILQCLADFFRKEALPDENL